MTVAISSFVYWKNIHYTYIYVYTFEEDYKITEIILCLASSVLYELLLLPLLIIHGANSYTIANHFTRAWSKKKISKISAISCLREVVFFTKNLNESCSLLQSLQLKVKTHFTKCLESMKTDLKTKSIGNKCTCF